MTAPRPRPTYCAFGDGGHRAAYRVKSSWREAVTCLDHLKQAKRWAGAGALTEPLAGSAPPPEQTALF